MSRQPNGGFIGKENITDNTTASGVYTLSDVARKVADNEYPPARFTPSRSLRFRKGVTAYLNRTPSSAGNRRIFTYSGWVKLGDITSRNVFLSAGTSTGGGGPGGSFYINNTAGGSKIELIGAGGTSYQVQTTQVFRDPSAWYHVVVAFDTTQSISSNRIKLYINGSQVTRFDATSYPSQNFETDYMNNVIHGIGIRTDDSMTTPFDGYMAEINVIDGQALTPASFGEYETRTGEWKPKRYAGTYGTNGFYLPFSDNSSTSSSALGRNNVPQLNYLQYSEELSNTSFWRVSNGSITANSTVAPDGTTTAETFTDNTANGPHRIENINYDAVTPDGFPFIAGRRYTISYYVKYISQQYVGLVSGGLTGLGLAWYQRSACFDLVNGTVARAANGGSEANITSVGNGWYRLSLSLTPATTNIDYPHFAHSPDATMDTNVYVGSGAQTFVWGAQLNEGQLQPYVKTTTVAANNWTLNNFSLTADTTYDSMVDVPGVGSQVTNDIGGVVRGNYATLNPLFNGGYTLTEGNLFANGSSAITISTMGMPPSSGKWYWEAIAGANTTTTSNVIIMGMASLDRNIVHTGTSSPSRNVVWYTDAGSGYNAWWYENGTEFKNVSIPGFNGSSSGTVWQFAYDSDTGKWWLGKNGTWAAGDGSLTGNPSVGNNPVISIPPTQTMTPYLDHAGTGQSMRYNFGQRPFAYTPPAGFKSLCTTNLPEPTIKKPQEEFDVKLWNGNGTTQTIGNTARQRDNYQISNSLRFNPAESSRLTRTPASASNRKTWTWSGWVKRGSVSDSTFVSLGTTLGVNLRFSSGNLQSNILTVGSSTTTQRYTDTSKWYHIILALDTTQAINSNRLRLYVDGLESSYSANATISQNADFGANTSTIHALGVENRTGSPSSDSYFDGYLAEVNFVDGQALTPESFGVFDVDGSWQAKRYTGTYGTNGYYLPFSDDRNSTTLSSDTSGNNNNWTAVGIAPPVPSATNAPNVLYYGNPGTYTWTAPTGVTSVNYLVVAGGGGGGGNFHTVATGGGGGAGGMLAGTLSVTPGTSYTVTVGNGGAGGTGGAGTNGTNGTNSVFASLTSVGGGGGATNQKAGLSGGSGGGASGPTTPGSFAGGAGTAGQGNNGGSANQYQGGGGGGAGAVGDGPSNNPSGGAGLASAITGVSAFYAGGGGSTGGGIGGGGAAGVSGTPNTGGGGGNGVGGANNPGASGGSGVVMLSYTNANSYIGVGANASTTDSALVDVPTDWGGDGTDSGKEVRGNYCVLDANTKGSFVNITNGGLTITGNTAENSAAALGTINVTSGKWYWENTVTTAGGISYIGVGRPNISWSSLNNAETAGDTTNVVYMVRTNGATFGDPAAKVVSNVGITFATGDVLGLALDMDSGAMYISRNGTWVTSGNPTSGSSKTGAVFAWTAGTETMTAMGGGYSGSVNDFNFGQRAFTYAPPAGFKSLNTKNLNEQHPFVTGPDLVWVKVRNATNSHYLFDTVRGADRALFTDSTGAETNYSSTGRMTKFNSNGFDVRASESTGTNAAGSTYVSWNWNAGDRTVGNQDGAITSTVRANKEAGFSIVSYTGTGADTNVGHGLSKTPDFIIWKALDDTYNWDIFHKSLGHNATLIFTTAVTRNVLHAAPNQLTIPVKHTYTGGSAAGKRMIAYCWHEVPGYSKFGSYTGNGSSNGPFIYTGFKPRWIMIKRTDASDSWAIIDTLRTDSNGSNPIDKHLRTESTSSELDPGGSPGVIFDVLSNGFKNRESNGQVNGSGGNYIYAAFAETPFRYSTAR
jgi:3D (Asp-Asp-Asp) domain-containing protein